MAGRRRLQGLRGDKDLTQLSVARKAGLNATRYWQIENGEGAKPTKDEQAAVAAALDVSVNAIDWPDLSQVKAS